MGGLKPRCWIKHSASSSVFRPHGPAPGPRSHCRPSHSALLLALLSDFRMLLLSAVGCIPYLIKIWTDSNVEEIQHAQDDNNNRCQVRFCAYTSCFQHVLGEGVDWNKATSLIIFSCHCGVLLAIMITRPHSVDHHSFGALSPAGLSGFGFEHAEADTVYKKNDKWLTDCFLFVWVK